MAEAKPTVLIVDDDLDLREAIATVVENDAFPVAVASNGLEALAYLHDHRDARCIVLLDLMMPVMDGWTFLEVMRQESLDVPVVVFSAMPQPSLPAGVEALRKPVTGETLRRALSKYA